MNTAEKAEAKQAFAKACEAGDWDAQAELLQLFGIMQVFVGSPWAQTPQNPLGFIEVTKGKEN